MPGESVRSLTFDVTVHSGAARLRFPVDSLSLSRGETHMDGTVRVWREVDAGTSYGDAERHCFDDGKCFEARRVDLSLTLTERQWLEGWLDAISSSEGDAMGANEACSEASAWADFSVDGRRIARGDCEQHDALVRELEAFAQKMAAVTLERVDDDLPMIIEPAPHDTQVAFDVAGMDHRFFSVARPFPETPQDGMAMRLSFRIDTLGHYVVRGEMLRRRHLGEVKRKHCWPGKVDLGHCLVAEAIQDIVLTKAQTREVQALLADFPTFICASSEPELDTGCGLDGNLIKVGVLEANDACCDNRLVEHAAAVLRILDQVAPWLQ